MHRRTHSIDIHEGWVLSSLQGTPEDPDRLLELSVTAFPAQVHEVLLDHGIIKAQRLPEDARSCLWVAEQDWSYSVRFSLPDETLPLSQSRLVCAGIDTIARIFINSILIGEHRDQYLPFTADITPHLKKDNTLRIDFTSPFTAIEAIRSELGDTLPPEIEPHRYLRKSNEDFTDFNGARPYLTTIGIYDTVQVILHDGLLIDQLSHDTALAAPYDQATITVTASGSLSSGSAGSQIASCRAVFRVTDPDGTELAAATTDLSLIPDEPTCWHAAATFPIEAPQLWWPLPLGDHPLYTLSCVLHDTEGTPFTQRTIRIGIREILVDEGLHVSVNGVPVRLWGACMTPPQGLTHRYDAERTERLLSMAADAHMNTLRLWGPGAPSLYDDRLLDLADSLGIMIWAEFFHTWGMYPVHEAYRELCRLEARHTIRRLRHHPSIILWCGGNEGYMGSEIQFPGLFHFGQVIYAEDYARVCAEEDPSRRYIINSPHGGAFANDPAEGDSHSYTHIWFVPDEAYPVIFTENTRISAPPLRSLRALLGDDLWPEEGFSDRRTERYSPPMPPAWCSLAPNIPFIADRLGPVETFYDTGDTPAGLIYRIGAAQSLYLRRYVERYRQGRPADDTTHTPRCLGHLIWKLNDTRPMIYSAIIDALLEPSMGYYALKRAYAPILLSFSFGDRIHLWLTNESGVTIDGTVICCIQDINNESPHPFYRWDMAVRLDSTASEPIIDLTEAGMFRRDLVLFAALYDSSGREIARTTDFADIERHLSFPEGRFHLFQPLPVPTASSSTVRCYDLCVSADTYVRSLELTGLNDDEETFGWSFSDNYFDMMPGEIRTIRVTSPEPDTLGDPDREQLSIATSSPFSSHRSIQRLPHGRTSRTPWSRS